MKTYSLEEMQQQCPDFPGLSREGILQMAREAGAEVADNARIWFEEYSAEEMKDKAPLEKGVRLGHVSAFVEMKPN